MKLREGDLVMGKKQSIGIVLSLSESVFGDDRLVEVLFSKPILDKRLVCESTLAKVNV